MSTRNPSTVRNHTPLYSETVISNDESTIEEVTRDGRDYLVFPIIALREMVLEYPEHGTSEFLPAESFRDTAHLWSGTPLVYIHPENDKGTAATPDSFVSENIGQVFRPDVVDGDKLKVQAWLDVQKALDIGGLAADVVEKLRAGEDLSVSAGYGTIEDNYQNGKYDGNSYDLSQGTILPDHVAIFPSSEFTARCDWADGCGAPRANYVDTDSANTNAEIPSVGVPPEFTEGDVVEWQASPGRMGVVVHNPEDEPDTVMVELLDDDMELTGYTESPSPDDLVATGEQMTLNIAGAGSASEYDIQPILPSEYQYEQKYGDVYTTEDGASERASRLGCSGTHAHSSRIGTVYMPCEDHDEYERVMRAQAESNMKDPDRANRLTTCEVVGRYDVDRETAKAARKLVNNTALELSDVFDDSQRSNEYEPQDDDPCEDGYVQFGFKEDEDGNTVPNCIPEDQVQNYRNQQQGEVPDEWPEVAHDGLCEEINAGNDDGFFTACMERSFSGEETLPDEPFCAWLHNYCFDKWPAESANSYYGRTNAMLVDHDRGPLELWRIDHDEDVITNVDVEGTDIDLTPPQEVQEVAQDFLDAHDEGLIPDSCGTADTDSTGYRRAEQLASGDELAVDDITGAGDGMYGWFSRHGEQGNGEPDANVEEFDSERAAFYSDCGYAAWRSWGGDPAWEWVEDRYEAIQAAITDTEDEESTENMQTDDDPATLFSRFLHSIGVTQNSQSTVDDVESATDGDEAESTDDVDARNNASAEATSVEEQDSTDDTETASQADGDTMTDDDTGADRTNEMTLAIEDLAEHTMFSVDTLEDMDDDVLEQLESEVITEILGSGRQAENKDYKDDEYHNSEADGSTADQSTDDSTVTNNESNHVTEEQLESRLDDFERKVANSLSDTLESTLGEFADQQRQNQIKTDDNVQIVANALDISEEAAESLPTDDFKKQLSRNRTNYAAVPGQVNRNYGGSNDTDYEDYPAGGRAEYEARKNGGD